MTARARITCWSSTTGRYYAFDPDADARRPRGARDVAAEVLTQRFAGEPLQLPDIERAALASTLARAGVAGGASYDGLVALEAAAHGQALFTLDRRAQDAYRRLGAAFEVLAG